MTRKLSEQTPYLQKTAAAEFLGVSPRTLENLVAAKRIPVVRPCKRRVLFDKADLVAFMDAAKA